MAIRCAEKRYYCTKNPSNGVQLAGNRQRRAGRSNSGATVRSGVYRSLSVGKAEGSGIIKG